MRELQEFRIDVLLERLQSNTAEILTLIDQDDKLNKREHSNGLVIANASKNLFTPEAEHHLYAKGIVYRRDPYEVVSLPLLKIYNHGERGLVDNLTYSLADQDEVRICLPFKEDGYMGQLFAHEKGPYTVGPDVYCTTRSMLEGVPVEHDYDFDYVGAIRAVANMKYPRLLDPEFLGDLCITCEVLHPGAESGITRYGGRQDLVVLAVFDRKKFRYWTNQEVQTWCAEHGLNAVDTLASDTSLEEAVSIVRAMEEDDSIPEGGVICFEHGGQLIHRVKAKTERWCREFSLRYSCSIRSVTNMCFGNSEFEDWENFRQYLIDEGLTEEETLDYYKAYHDKYLDWLTSCHQQAEGYQKELASCLDAIGDVDPSEEGRALALYAKEKYKRSDFVMIMNLYRHANEERFLLDVMWQNELYSGIKGLIQDAKNALAV